MITFISGGVRSGKSSLAEKLAIHHYNENFSSGLYYVATASPTIDDEMKQRIMMHQHNRGPIWTTIEESCEIDTVLYDVLPRSVVLIDCLTVWSSNVIFSEKKTKDDLIMKMNHLFSLAKTKQLCLIFVSNDLNEELPIKDEWVQLYIKSLENVHKLVVENCDTAIQVVAGHPIYWKENA